MKKYSSILVLGILLAVIVSCSPIKESPEPADIKPGDSTSNVNNNTGNADVYIGLWRIIDRRIIGASVAIDSVFDVHLQTGGNGTFTYYNANGNVTSTHPTIYQLFKTANPRYIDFTVFGKRTIIDKTGTTMVWEYNNGGLLYEETLQKQ